MCVLCPGARFATDLTTWPWHFSIYFVFFCWPHRTGNNIIDLREQHRTHKKRYHCKSHQLTRVDLKWFVSASVAPDNRQNKGRGRSRSRGQSRGRRWSVACSGLLLLPLLNFPYCIYLPGCLYLLLVSWVSRSTHCYCCCHVFVSRVCL